MGTRRPALTCKRCRERKVLCDRKKPCFACIRSKKPDLCVYDASNELKQIKGSSSFHTFKFPSEQDKLLLNIPLSDLILKLNGNNLYNSNLEKINFYAKFTPRLIDVPIEIEYGPLAWPFIEQKEPALHMILSYIHKLKMTNDNSLSIRKVFQASELNADISNQSECRDETANTLQLKIKAMLPNRKIVWNLISIFFRHVYSFMPVLDEVSFRMEIIRIIGPEEYDDVTISPLIQKSDDFAFIGILLIVLRTSYLQDDGVNKLFVSNDTKIGAEYIDVAILCLRRYNVLGKISLTVFQCAFCLRLHQKVVPKFQDDSYNNNKRVYNGMLVQMAYSLGLNKDFESSDKRMNNLKQKLWHLLVLFDIIEAYSFGSPLTTNRIYSNSKLLRPHEIDDNSSNNIDCALEQSVLSNMINLLSSMDSLIDILNMVLDIKGQSRISSLVRSLNKMEIQLTKRLGFIKDVLNPISNVSVLEIYDKIHKMKSLMSLKKFLLSIYQHLAIHFEHTENIRLALFYRKKIQSFSIGEMIPILLPLTENMRIYFGHIGVLVITYFFFQLIYRTSLLNIEILIRLKYHFHNFRDIYMEEENTSSIYAYLCKSIEKLEWCINIYISCLSNLSIEYNYTDKPKNLLNAYLCVLKDNNFYEANVKNNVLDKTKYTVDYLKQTCYVYDAALGEIANSPYSSDSFETLDFGDELDERDTLSLIDLETLNFDTIDYLNQFGNNNDIFSEIENSYNGDFMASTN